MDDQTISVENLVNVSVDSFNKIIDNYYLDIKTEHNKESTIQKGLDSNQKFWEHIIFSWITMLAPIPKVDRAQAIKIIRNSHRKSISNLSVREKRAKRVSLLSITLVAAVAVFAVGAFFVPFSKIFLESSDSASFVQNENKNKGQEFQASDVLKKGDYLLGEEKKIKIHSGELSLEKYSFIDDTLIVNINTETMVGDFDLKPKLVFTINHPLVYISVIGTKFNLSVNSTNGSLSVSEGIVQIKHKVSGEIIRVTHGETIRFGKTIFVKNSNVKKPIASVRRVKFKNGKILSGVIVSETSNSMTLKTKQGLQIVIDKNDILND